MIKRHFFTLLASLIVIILSVIPLPEVPHLVHVPLMDKWVHFLMYGFVVCAVWADWFRRDNHGKLTSSTLCCLLLYPTLLGGCLELVQEYLTPTRNGDWWDFMADEVGVALGFLAGLPWLFRKKK